MMDKFQGIPPNVDFSTFPPSLSLPQELPNLSTFASQILLQSPNIPLQLSIPTSFPGISTAPFPPITTPFDDHSLQSTTILDQLNQQLMLYNLLLRPINFPPQMTISPNSSATTFASSPSSTPSTNLPQIRENPAAIQIENENTNVRRAFGIGGSSPKRHPTICVVCGKMSLYNYYGVKCCESCKQFFRRIIVKQTEFFCGRNGNCEIDGGVEKCRGCRMDKCLFVGMDPKLISGQNNEFKGKFIEKLEARRANLLGKYKNGLRRN